MANPYRCLKCRQASFASSLDPGGLCPWCRVDVEHHAHTTALDIAVEPDRRRAEHLNHTLRRVEGGDEHG